MVFFGHTYLRISVMTARLAVTLGSLCRDRFGLHYHPRLGSLRAACRVSCVTRACAMCNGILFSKEKTGLRSKSFGPIGVQCNPKLRRAACRVLCVTRARAVCNAILCFQKNKQAAGPSCLGATLSLRTRVRAPASFAFFCFFFPHFLNIMLMFFAQIWYDAYMLHGSYSLCRDRFEVYHHQVGARVPFVTSACALWNARCFFNIKNIALSPNIACGQLRACGRRFEPR